MRNKIYAKLYEFCDIKTWVKDTDKDDNVKYYSKYYKEYKLEYQNKNCGWFYKVFKATSYGNDYESNPCHKGLVTLNKFGKFLTTIGLLSIITLIRLILYGTNLIPSYTLIFLFIAGSILFSFLFVPIFNWKFYIYLRKVQYFIRNNSYHLRGTF